MSTSSGWNTCEKGCCAVAVLVALVAIFATREPLSLLVALLFGLALGFLVWIALTRLFCTAEEAQVQAPAQAAAAPETAAAPKPAAADEMPAEKPAPPAEDSPASEAPESPTAQAASDPAPALVKSGTLLPGQEELASRKGTWRYQGAASEAGAGTGSDTATEGAAAPAADAGQPEGLTAARDGGADDLKQIKGVGPKLEQLLNSMGFFHYDQIAAWDADAVAWVDENLKGFKGRVSRDGWVEQAKILASGGETEFSKRVEDGDVY